MGMAISVCGGHVIDPGRGINAVQDIYCVGDRISAAPGESPVVVDASDHFVFPGLIDYHAHLFRGGDFFGINADLQLSYGVTTILDAGSSGSLNFEMMYRNVIEPSDIRVKALVNICAFGNPGGGYHEELDPRRFRTDDLKQIFAKYYPDTVCGLKIRISREIMGQNGMDAVQRTVELAEELGVPLVVHIPDPFCDLGELLERLRPGDTVAHVYHGKGQTILDENGNVRKEFWTARERGVLFDVANACSNCDHRVAEKAIDQGFLPDILSTDLTVLGYGKPHMVKNLPFVMSKFLALGLTLEQVIECATTAPAKAMGMEDKIGTLRPGASGDITICRLQEKKMLFTDAFGNSHTGDRVLVPVMTIHNGRFMYCSPEFN